MATSIENAYAERKAIMDYVLKSVSKCPGFPRGVYFKYEISGLPSFGRAENGIERPNEKEPNILNFYRGRNLIGRVYFLADQIGAQPIGKDFTLIEDDLDNALYWKTKMTILRYR